MSAIPKKVRTAIGTTSLAAIAERGYFKGEDILACHEAGISTLVSKTKTSKAKVDGQFDKAISFAIPKRTSSAARQVIR